MSDAEVPPACGPHPDMPGLRDAGMDRWVSENDGSDENEFAEWFDKRRSKGRKAMLSLNYKEVRHAFYEGYGGQREKVAVGISWRLVVGCQDSGWVHPPG